MVVPVGIGCECSIRPRTTPTCLTQRIYACELLTTTNPMTDTELESLGEFLRKCKGGKAMNIEEVDGFFSALIAGPEVVMPSEYLPEVFGGEVSDTCEFAGLDEANDILGLMMRHWNTIAAALHKEDVYLPILLEGRDRCLPWQQLGSWVHTRSSHAQRKLGRTHDR